MSLPTSGTPSSRYDTTPIKASEINNFIKTLSERFGLQLPIPRDAVSPVSRRSALRDYDARIGDEIVSHIIFLSRRKTHALQGVVQAFKAEADTLRVSHGWVYKPNGDHDVIPFVGDALLRDGSGRDQRLQLRECLLLRLKEARESKIFGSSDNVEPKSTRVREVSHQTELDSSPIPLNLGQRPVKRTSGEFSAPDISAEFKKPRAPALWGSPGLTKAVDSAATTSSKQDSALQTVALSTNSTSSALFPGNSLNPYHQQTSRTVSANTSFSSIASGVFTGRSIPGTGTATQESSFNTSFQSIAPPIQKIKAMSYELHSSQYRSMDEDDFIEIINEDLQESSGVDISMSDVSVGPVTQGGLSQRLQQVFPELPQCLKKAPLCVRYEITRVFLHAEASMDGLHVHDRDIGTFLDYNALWKFLKDKVPQLQGKPFPEKCTPKIWASSLERWSIGNFEGVEMSASLKFASSKTGPIFQVQLKPLSIALTHRFGRRFGNDRFLEIILPNLNKCRPPGSTEDDLEMRRQEIIRWIKDNGHKFMGIEWRPFGLNDTRSKKINNIESKKASEDAENNATHRIFFFAVDGIGFQTSSGLPARNDDPQHHTKFTVKGLLNWLIPFYLEKNQKQPYLKLFSRISLGLSKTYATIPLRATEITFVRYDYCSKSGEVMNDGCGQISRKLAHHIAQKLKLDYTPSAFQARIGGAKGMWIVDVKDFGDKTNIKIYPSQVKWDNNSFFVDPSHRIFEVICWSRPVRSATLNLQFLPILEDRGRNNGKGMRDALSRVLENGLTYEISRQREAMDSPQAFRKWVRETAPRITDRNKLGQVGYEAGLPKSQGEKMNLLLDAGFNPKELCFLRDLAWKANVARGEILKKKLNISVGRSAYMLMVVDFAGILGPREVHVGFSTAFKDESTDFCDTILSNMDILVARSPAHYTSDIQKVRAVFKPELSALKDVIVFSTRGDFPLAGELSGGDYDGDIAWVCWQTEIVSEFENAKMPICSDMVKEGYITKNSTTYAELASKNPGHTIDAFLANSFDFNLKQNMLGICTNFKEKLCYAKKSVACDEAVFLSTLLSSLVDQAKQGYSFTDSDWERLKAEKIRGPVREPNYKRPAFNGNLRGDMHLIDHLKFRVAQKTIDDTLADLHTNLQTPEHWDDDVVQLAKFARKEAETSDEWAALLRALDADIKPIHNLWQKHSCPPKEDKESKTWFLKAIDEVYQQWRAIKPAMDTPFTRLLTMPYLTDAGLSTWELLKASILFRRSYVSTMVWWLAGKQIAHLKAMSKGPVSVIPTMYAMLKPDNTFVKSLQVGDEHHPKFWEVRTEAVVDEDEELDYED
ncbi:hypothetical protein VC83_06038 [Pseudogymnoascus destructans]|uniref:RNA-dependent RNA polymerase n=2 Tax=Pseudogymnoascus destructans TaxID=655981 RepID=L8FS68_PSED2|nr:uncharacterized protein VC83_06038 [Pseudogymnoascus destructans]ELR03707.1 hypothetical protein GMDG_06341 [Pseudogymnoascus destructans 20631-21]OAF57177.1 hypothetical protein VC83_06038 [Pseudogymnoascus destructans]